MPITNAITKIRTDSTCFKNYTPMQYVEEIREYKKRHAQERPEIYKAANHKRRAAKLATGESFTAQDVEQLYDEQAGLCAYCSLPVGDKYHVDHIVPLSRGGNDTDNIYNLHVISRKVQNC